ncbi:MAG: adenosylcobinamide-phosphate synthase CbiB [Bacillota bacterium]
MEFKYLSIFIGFTLNYLFGSLKYITHPVIIIGNLISFFEKLIYKDKKINGLFLWGIIILISYIIPWSILKLFSFNKYLKLFIEIFFIIEILAINGLKKEPLKIYNALKNDNISLARKELSMLVTRDTTNMDKNQIIMSTMETIAENIVDGITAPLFYIFLGGPALGFLYKGVNTLDSMVGYKNSRYSNFGFFSAKLDDIFNFIPARITTIMIFMSVIILNYNISDSINVFIKDKDKSSSPNSGFSEAPIAGALEVYFGGKLEYFNKVVEKPKIGYKKDFKLSKINDTIRIMKLSSFLTLVLYFIMGGIIGL